jgi:hypothetical protein
MNRINRYLSFIFFGLGVLLWLSIPSQVSMGSSIAQKGLGPDFFPSFVAVMTMICAVGLYIQTVFRMRMEPDSEEGEQPIFSWKRERNSALVFVVMLVSVFLIDEIGFIPGAFLMGLGLLWILKTQKWWHYIVYTVFLLLVYFVFTKLLYIHLPSGILS